jgi:hypothetical protein
MCRADRPVRLYVVRDVDDLAARLNPPIIAEQHPVLAVGRLMLTQCAADSTNGCASATAPATPTADISGRSGVSSTMQAQCNGSMPSARQRRSAATLSLQPWTTCGTLEFTHAGGGRAGAAAADRRDRRPPPPISSLMPWPSRHMEDLERLAPRREVQAAVGEHAVDVQDQEFDPRQAASPCAPSNHTRAQQIVHVERAHDLLVASTTTSEVMRGFPSDAPPRPRACGAHGLGMRLMT